MGFLDKEYPPFTQEELAHVERRKSRMSERRAAADAQDAAAIDEAWQLLEAALGTEQGEFGLPTTSFVFLECTLSEPPRGEVQLGSVHPRYIVDLAQVRSLDIGNGKLCITVVATSAGPTLALQLEGTLPAKLELDVVVDQDGRLSDLQHIATDLAALIPLESSKGVGDVVRLGVRRVK